MSDGSLRPVSTATRPAFYPGAVVLAAAASAAGFTQADPCPTVTDAKGVRWTPSRLQVILAVCGAESSGNAWAYHLNESDGSCDHGPWQINDKAHPEFFGTSAPPYLCAYNPWDAAVMAWQVYVAAGYQFTPWMGFSGSHWLGWRDEYRDETWLGWAAAGISGLGVMLSAGATLLQAATVDLDEPA
jgi:Lysozyme like domain